MAVDSERTDVERAVLDAAQRWLAATMRADADALEQLVTPLYTYTHATTASTDSRQNWLESFRSGGRIYKVYEIFDVDLRVFPGIVVLAGRAHQEMSPRGEPIELNTHFTSVWVEGAGGWRCEVWQATRFAEPS